MRGRLVAALAERDGLDRRLEDAQAAPQVAMHPGIGEAYVRNVSKLAATLGAEELEASEARLALRNLIELITAEPRAEGRGLDLVVHGRLAQILQIANNRPELDARDGCMFNLVAGTGYRPEHTIAIAVA